jgi:uncharacterized protein YaiE (UPF0345 family)
MRGLDLASLRLSLSNADAARAALAAVKHPQYHHNVMLGRLVEMGNATAQELVDWVNGNLEVLGTGQDVWKRYGAGCHVAYFIRRWRGIVTATKADGTVVVVAARKVTKKAKKEIDVGEVAEVLADATA